MAILLKYVNTPWLNVRIGPGTNFGVKYQLPWGTDITVKTPPIVANGYHWVERAKYPGLWVADELLTDKNPYAPTSDLRVGVHLSMYDYGYTDFLAVLRTMAAQGRPCPCVLVLGPSEIGIDQLLAASPYTEYISRVFHPGDETREMGAATYFTIFVDGDPMRRRYRFHQINNENTDFSDDAIAWWIQQCIFAESHGYRLLVPVWPTGNPPDLSVWQRPSYLNFLRFVRDHGHRFGLHEYFRNDGDWELFRFIKHVYPNLPEDLRSNMPQVRITEWGIQGGRDISAADWLAYLKSWQAGLAPYPWVKVCTWAIGDTGASPNPGQDWRGDNWQNKMTLLTKI